MDSDLSIDLEKMEISLFVLRSLTKEWNSLSDEDKVRSKEAYKLMQSSKNYSIYAKNVLDKTSHLEERPSLYEENIKKIELFNIQ